MARPRRTAQSESAASRVAQSYELVHRILTHCQSQHGDASLVPAAVANRFVGNAALDVLWETQKSVLPLILVLRHLIVEDTEQRAVWCKERRRWDRHRSEVKRVLYLAGDAPRTMSADDVERLQSYARRIRVLDDGPLAEGETNDIHLDRNVVVFFCGGSDEDDVLLPNLRRVEIGPRLASLFEDKDIWPAEDGEHRFYLSVFQPWGLYEHLGDLCRLDKLQSLGIQADNQLKVLPALRKLPALQELHLKFGETPPRNELRRLWLDEDDEDDEDCEGLVGHTLQSELTHGFSALRTLRLSDPLNLESVSLTLAHLSTAPLKLRTLHVRGRLHAACSLREAQTLYSAIRAQCVKSALTHLTVATQGWGQHPMRAAELFKSLLAFPNITHFGLDVLDDATDVDGALEAFARAWPRLESLTILNKPRDGARGIGAVNALASLACLAHRCPRLSDLAVQLKLDAVPKPVAVTPRAPLLGRRVTLHIGEHTTLEGADRERVSALVRYLESIFPYPSLTSITYDVLDTSANSSSEGCEISAPAAHGEHSVYSIREWLSANDLRELLGIEESDEEPECAVEWQPEAPKKEMAATSKKAAPVKETTDKKAPAAKKEPKAKGPAKTKKPPAKKASAAKKTVDAGANQASTSKQADVDPAEAAPKRATRTTRSSAKSGLEGGTPAPPATGPAQAFHEAGGHRLRSKRSTPAGGAQEVEPPAKRQRTAAAAPTKGPAKTRASNKRTAKA
ncbi:hypothetical protein HDZ31DRAFT_67758 [Schizophyllum fasciatum]